MISATPSGRLRSPLVSSPRRAAAPASARVGASIAVGLVCVAGAAAADGFGGIAANEKSYLAGPTRVCAPIAATAGVARGMPACRTAPTEEVAALSARMPAADRGTKAEVVARAKGRTLTIEDRTGAVLLTWDAPDPIGSVVDVWRSASERLIVVEYVVRRANREVHDVVGFDRGVGKAEPVPVAPPVVPPVAPVAPPVADTALAKAVAKARKTSGKAAAKAWTAVLTADADHTEARYRLAVADVAGKRIDAALAHLEQLAGSKRADAIEWLVEARGDRAFAKLIDNPRFRAAVGFDRPAATTYERLMGLGGRWEQSIVPCDRAELKLTFGRDRALTLALRTSCQGMRDKVVYRGTWAIAGDAVELRLPKLDTGDDVAPCALTADHDEDVLSCRIDEDLSFEARPVRR